MTSWSPQLSEAGPVYLAITRALEADIALGKLEAGEQLPTHRDLASTLGVNVGTVTRAYSEARRRGLIEGTVGRGTFVRHRSPSALSRVKGNVEGSREEIPIDLSINIPRAMPGPDLARGLEELAGREDLDHVMAYQEPVGSLDARRAGAQWLTRLRVKVDPGQVLVCSGAQHAILVALGAIAGPGDLVLCEELTYPGFLGAARMLGQRVRGIPIDENGIIPDALEEICREERPRLLYCMPSLQNPTCAQLSSPRRSAIAAIAERHDLMIVQDEIQTGLINDPGPSLAELIPDRVFTIASLSKTLSPGLRIAYLGGPAAFMGRLSEIVWSSVWMTSPLCAELASLWLSDGTADRVLDRRRTEIEKRHRMAAKILGDLACKTRTGSYHVWLELPEQWESRAFAAALLGEGVRVSPSNEFSVDGRAVREAIRISLSATPVRQDLARAMKAIRRLHDGAPGPSTLL